MIGSLLEQIMVSRPLASVVAGTSVQAGSSVNMEGCDGVLFIGGVGALTSTQVTSLKAQQSSDDGSTDAFGDIEGSSVGPFADADGGKLLVLDVYRPMKQYVKPVFVRGTANAVLDFIIAIRYQVRSVPTTQPSVVVDSAVLVSPDEGTA